MSKLVVASYCTTFLKSEMLHIYRQVTGLRDVQHLRHDEEDAEHRAFPVRRYRAHPGAAFQSVSAWLAEICRAPAADRLSRRISAAGQPARTPRRGSDAHLFWAHRRPLAAFHPVLGQTVHRLVSWRGCDAEGGQSRLRGEVEQSFSMLSRWSWHARVHSSSGSSGLVVPPEKIRINRTGIPLAAISGRAVARRRPRRPWRFLQACRLIPKKGLTTCLRAFALFRRRKSECGVAHRRERAAATCA